MEQAGLTHHDCVALIGDRARRVTATISVDGGEPVPLAAYACPGGDLLVPTGTDPSLPRAAVSKPVTVEFTETAGRGDENWTISGTGLAQPLSHHDRPHDDHPQAMLYAFDNGIRVLMARLSAVRAEVTALPQQRSSETPLHRPHSHRLDASSQASHRLPTGRHRARGRRGATTIGPRPPWVAHGTAERSTKNPGASQADLSAGETPGSDGESVNTAGPAAARRQDQRSGE
ncbi:hypothetical protein FHS23_004123 [Prauserella isguenensis]|uniref:Uncharacterized protein n=1 Tax=Prauserella isguenensis TaxID=1470180 RepID=A0A839S7W6_9PSEU|nr:hypothetical protein [Prauserella isguenensis]MBB3053080.1 hypothetical protein [Prauserella isguenensis]